MSSLRSIALTAAVTAFALGCNNDKPPPSSGGGAGTGGSTGDTIKLETWMDGIAKNGEVEVSAMPENVLYKVTDKQPVSATEAAATTPEPGKLAVVYDEDPTKLRFLFEADPRFEAP